MNRGVTFKVDRRDLARADVHAAAATALADAAEHVLTEANRTVPHDEGTLERSGKTSADEANLRAAVSYDTPYAERQHEDTRLNHPGGRRAKWLEHTIREQQDQIGDYIADRIREALG